MSSLPTSWVSFFFSFSSHSLIISFYRLQTTQHEAKGHCLGLSYVFFLTVFFTLLTTNFFFFFFTCDYNDYDDDDDDDYVGSRCRCGRPRRCNGHCLGLWYVFFRCYFIITSN